MQEVMANYDNVISELQTLYYITFRFLELPSDGKGFDMW